MKETQIAVQLYTIRDYLQKPEDFAEIIPKVRKIGYRGVETGLGQIETKELKRILDGEGIRVVATHIPIEDLVDKIDAVIEDQKILGAEYAVCPWLQEEYRNGAGFRKVAKDLSQAGEVLAENGITLCYHNHAFEFEKFGKKTGMEILYSESDPRYLKAELDTYWIVFGGEDPIQWCSKLSKRLPLVHLKDLGIKDNKQVYMEVGEGNLCWDRILTACKKAGVNWYIVEQDFCQGDSLKSIETSLNNLHKFGLK